MKEAIRSTAPARETVASQPQRTNGHHLGASSQAPAMATVAQETPLWAQLASQPTELEERQADARASSVLHSPVGLVPPPDGDGSGVTRTSTLARQSLPAGAPAPLVEQAPRGRPLPLVDRSWFEPHFGGWLAHVRIHDTQRAAALADAVDARAFTVGSHVFFNRGEYQPGAPAGRTLLAHELAHVEQAGSSVASGTVRLWRKPKTKLTDEPPRINPPAVEQAKQEEWVRLEVFAIGMDAAAMVLAGAKLSFKEAGSRPLRFVGLHPKFVKVYGSDGKSLGPRIKLKETNGLRFNRGVYIQLAPAKGLVALTQSTKDPTKIGFESSSRSVLGRRDLTAKEKADLDAEIKKAKEEGREPRPVQSVLNFPALVTEPERYRTMLGLTDNPVIVYFVTTYDLSGAGGKGGGEQPSLYASPIQGRGDGKPANAPPWPVSVDGPKLAPIDSNPTYSAKVDWTANNNLILAAQVISQVGETIHYRWELFDITQHAKRQLAKDPAATKDTRDAPPEKSLEDRIEEYKAAKAGSGKDVTGLGGARREFSREFEDWWKDTKRAAKGARDPSGDTVGERLSNAAANRLALELAPVSLLATAVGAALRFLAELFAGPRKQQEIPLKTEGIFLVRVITTPAINQDREGNDVVRPPSVAARVVEVTPMDKAVRETLDEPDAQLAELQAQIDLAEKAGQTAKAEYLRSLLAEAKLRFQGSPLDLLVRQREARQKALEKYRKDFPTLSTYSREREIEMLDDQIALYRRHAKQVAKGSSLRRLNATLISEVTAQQYPLLLSAAPMEPEEGGKAHRWLVSDVTNRSGEAFIGQGDTPSAALTRALDKFGGKAAYGRGRIGVRTAGLNLEAGAPAEILVDSAPTDWALAEKRIDDLVMTLVALGVVVASAGTAGAVIGAGVAAARLIHRWEQGTLYLDAQTVSDVLGLLGGLGASLQLAAGLRVQKLDKVFTVVQEGRATEAQVTKAIEALKGAQQVARGVELANEALNYAGVIWGNVTFLDQMLTINAQEASGAITHAEARRMRASAISSAVQNNGLFVAGNVLKAKALAKAAEAPGAPSKAVPPKETAAPKEPVVPKEPATPKQGPTRAETPVPKRPPAPKDVPPAETPTPNEAVPARETAPPKETPPPTKETAPPPTEKVPAEGGPAREKVPVEKVPPKERPLEKAAHEAAHKVPLPTELGPIGERRATLEELQAALPPDLRRLVSIDPTLQGDDVRVVPTVDKATGLISEIQVRCGPDARPRTVALHEGTVRTMESYQGFMGRVRQAISWLADIVGIETIRPENKAAFEAALEIRKLPKLIEAQLDRMKAMEPNARDMAAAELENLQNQLDKHLRTLDYAAGGEGQGYVAAKGLSKAKQKKYAELLGELRKHEAGSKEHKRIRREMYELTGGDLPYANWEKVYDSNVDRARKGSEAEKAEQKRLGWGEHQKTVDVPGGGTRRLDIAEATATRRRGVEVKAYESGVVYATEEILGEVGADAKLIRYRRWEITWLFVDCEPSGPLLTALHKAKITVEVRARGQRSRVIPPPK